MTVAVSPRHESLRGTCGAIETARSCSLEWAELAEAVERVEACARLVGFPDSEAESFTIALGEALFNAATHGRSLEKGGRIFLRYGVEREYLWARVRAESTGFELSHRGYDLPSGRGLGLMRSLCDVVRWNPGGSEVFLLKLSRPSGRAARPPARAPLRPGQ